MAHSAHAQVSEPVPVDQTTDRDALSPYDDRVMLLYLGLFLSTNYNPVQSKEYGMSRCLASYMIPMQGVHPHHCLCCTSADSFSISSDESFPARWEISWTVTIHQLSCSPSQVSSYCPLRSWIRGFVSLLPATITQNSHLREIAILGPCEASCL